MAKLAFCRVSVALRKASSPQEAIMAVPPLDTKGKVTPVRGENVHRAEHVEAGLKHHHGGGGAGGDDVKELRPARQARTANTARVRMDSTASRAMISPHSSHSMPNTRSVSPAPYGVEPALAGAHPTRPPEAAADMVRVCW